MIELEPVCSKDECRQKFKDLGLTYNDITEGDILTLVMILNTQIKLSNKVGETSVNTMRLSPELEIRTNEDGTIKHCYLYMSSHYFDNRECITFGKDGFIGFAGWADSGNLKPIIRSFTQWCDVIAKQKEYIKIHCNS